MSVSVSGFHGNCLSSSSNGTVTASDMTENVSVTRGAPTNAHKTNQIIVLTRHAHKTDGNLKTNAHN